MTAKATPIDRQIKQRIIDACPKFQGRVYDGDVSDGELVPISEQGYNRPYVTLIYGGVFRPGRRMRGISGTRDDVKYHTLMVLVTGPSLDLTNELTDEVRDALEGFEPEGGSELYEESTGSARYPSDSTLKPVRYTNQMQFSLLISP